MPLQPPRAFIVSPFGDKPDALGNIIHFDDVFRDLIEPAIAAAGLEAFRADMESRGGNIRTDMFQELLLADLVVAELSIDNPNAWYELGVRHSLRARGVVSIFTGRAYLPFDVGPDRALYYRVKDGRPDPEHLDEDRKRLAEMAVATLDAWHGRRVSPVYHLLPNLAEPDWRTLRLGEVNEHWERLEDWERRVGIAVKANRPADVQVLAEEPPTRVLQLEALRTAGQALVRLGRYAFALEVLDRALALNPEDVVCCQQKALALGRLGRHAEAQVLLQKIARGRPRDGETLGLIGRTLKDEWVAAWCTAGASPEEMREAAAGETALLLEAALAYTAAFRAALSGYYPGINAVTLGTLWQEMTGDTDPEIKVEAMAHGVRWAVDCALAEDKRSYWARATLAELEVLTADADRVRAAYRDAVAVAPDWFALDSARQQLCLLRDLAFRREQAEAGIEVLEKRQQKLARQHDGEAGGVILFSGHMIDRPDRPRARFPENKVAAVEARIREVLEDLDAGPGDVAICGAACGGDLLFAEACLARGLRLEVRLALLENEFLKESVSFAAGHWQDRYDRVKTNASTSVLILPQQLGPTPAGVSPFARNNLWMMYSALAYAPPEETDCILLWNGGTGDGPGGTQHMHDLISRITGRKPIVIDPTAI